MVRDLVAVQNYEQIERLCKVLSEQFVLSPTGNNRRGGLIGIAALAIACGKVCEQRFQFENSQTSFSGSSTIQTIPRPSCPAMLCRQRSESSLLRLRVVV